MRCHNCDKPATTQLTCSCGNLVIDVCEAPRCQPPPGRVCPGCTEAVYAGPLRVPGSPRWGRTSLASYASSSDEIGLRVSKELKTATFSSECVVMRPPPKDAKLVATLLELTFLSDVVAASGGRTLEPPHWRSDFSAGELRSAVYTVAAVAAARATVKIRIDVAIDQPKTGRLVGSLSMLRFVCEDVPLTVGTHDVEVQIEDLPEYIAQVHGEAAWELSSSAGDQFEMGGTLLELFVILAAPGPSFRECGVWVEVLDFLLTTVQFDEARITDGADATNLITRYCHFTHGLIYGSANHYAAEPRGGSFSLSAYMDCVDVHANCYDQAAAVQVLSHAVGSPVKYHYAGCYGFILPTRLLGGTKTNNPGFRATGAPPIVTVNSSARTGFTSHAFCTLAERVFDACVGPHLGELSVVEYLEAAIDSSPEALELLKQKLRDRPDRNATDEDVEDGGITMLNAGFAGQVIRRNLRTELDQQDINPLLTQWVFTFIDLTTAGSSGVDVADFEALLVAQLVAAMDENPEVNEQAAVEALNHEELRSALLELLNEKYAKHVSLEQHRNREQERKEAASMGSSERERKAQMEQCENRKQYITWAGTVLGFDKSERSHGRPIYPYDPETLDPL